MLNKKVILLIAFGLLFLQSCQQAAQIKPGYSDGTLPLLDLSAHDSYQFNGKMSFSDGEDGGSGRISWENTKGLISTELKAPLGSKSWLIKEFDNNAELISNGVTTQAHSAQSLISNQLGWQVPWQQLKSWVVGKPHNMNQANIKWLTDGFEIIEDGWRIEYSRLKEEGDKPGQYLPYKMVARKAPYSIKLSVKQWSW